MLGRCRSSPGLLVVPRGDCLGVKARLRPGSLVEGGSGGLSPCLSLRSSFPAQRLALVVLMSPGADPLFETIQKTSFCPGGFLLLSERAVRTSQLRTGHVAGALTVSVGQKLGQLI